MVNGISLGATNPIKMMQATNAFKTAQESIKKEILPEENTASGINLTDNNFLLKNQNLEEIRDFAKVVGEDNLTNEDIKYGLTYGRSVIADYLI